MNVRRSVVVLGMLTHMPVAGVVWQTLHYLLGVVTQITKAAAS